MTLKNNRAPLLYYVKLCTSFQSYRWIQTRVTVRKRSIWVKIGEFLPAWPRNLTDDLENQWGTSSILHQALCTISKPSVNSNWSDNPETLNSGQNWRFSVPCVHATSSIVHHFIAICEYKLELLSGNAQFRSKSMFFSCVTLKFDR